jgi:hypothetical protein
MGCQSHITPFFHYYLAICVAKPRDWGVHETQQKPMAAVTSKKIVTVYTPSGKPVWGYVYIIRLHNLTQSLPHWGPNWSTKKDRGILVAINLLLTLK